MTKNLIKKLALMALVLGFGADATMTDAPAGRRSAGRRGRVKLNNQGKSSTPKGRPNRRSAQQNQRNVGDLGEASTLAAADQDDIKVLEQEDAALTEEIAKKTQEVEEARKTLNETQQRRESLLQDVTKRRQEVADQQKPEKGMTPEQFDEFIGKVPGLLPIGLLSKAAKLVKLLKEERVLVQEKGVVKALNDSTFRLRATKELDPAIEVLIKKNEQKNEQKKEDDKKDTILKKKTTAQDLLDVVNETEGKALLEYMASQINEEFRGTSSVSGQKQKYPLSKLRLALMNEAGSFITYKEFLARLSDEWKQEKPEGKNPFLSGGSFDTSMKDYIQYGRKKTQNKVKTLQMVDKDKSLVKNDVARKFFGLPAWQDDLDARLKKCEASSVQIHANSMATVLAETVKKQIEKLTIDNAAIQLAPKIEDVADEDLVAHKAWLTTKNRLQVAQVILNMRNAAISELSKEQERYSKKEDKAFVDALTRIEESDPRVAKLLACFDGTQVQKTITEAVKIPSDADEALKRSFAAMESIAQQAAEAEASPDFRSIKSPDEKQNFLWAQVKKPEAAALSIPDTLSQEDTDYLIDGVYYASLSQGLKGEVSQALLTRYGEAWSSEVRAITEGLKSTIASETKNLAAKAKKEVDEKNKAAEAEAKRLKKETEDAERRKREAERLLGGGGSSSSGSDDDAARASALLLKVQKIKTFMSINNNTDELVALIKSVVNQQIDDMTGRLSEEDEKQALKDSVVMPLENLKADIAQIKSETKTDYDANFFIKTKFDNIISTMFTAAEPLEASGSINVKDKAAKYLSAHSSESANALTEALKLYQEINK